MQWCLSFWKTCIFWLGNNDHDMHSIKCFFTVLIFFFVIIFTVIFMVVFMNIFMTISDVILITVFIYVVDQVFDRYNRVESSSWFSSSTPINKLFSFPSFSLPSFFSPFKKSISSFLASRIFFVLLFTVVKISLVGWRKATILYTPRIYLWLWFLFCF